MQCLGWKPQLSCYASIDGKAVNESVTDSCKGSMWFYLALAAAAVAGAVSGKRKAVRTGRGRR